MIIYMHTKKKYFGKGMWKNYLLFILGLCIVVSGGILIWVSQLSLPDFKTFSEIKLQSSTKIYDRTGKILLFDVNQNIKRSVIPYEDMGVNIKNATVAIEDSDFYNHNGIRLSSIFRATIWAKLTGKKVQGGSTITQQLIKNTLLTGERTLTRKVKEWILAVKLERVKTKDEILALYLNDNPYGGNVYGIEEASKMFFGKEPATLSLAESAYLAAIPNAPTHYSPYGKNKAALDERKNLVLKRMLDLKFINQAEYDNAKKEVVTFLPAQPVHIAAPHFVFFIKDYLEKKYGEDALQEGGLKVTTTLDYDLEMAAENSAKTHALDNEKQWNGKNAAVVVIDPKTGQILAMVGSRDYFDKKIEGNFNVATASRQPGSSFKPIVYALAFKEGYTENTVLFDVKTEFNASCSPTGQPLPNHTTATCYMPDDYDNGTRGPMSLKDALAQSINIVAVKLLYLVGIPDALNMAHDLGISTLNDPGRYGLSLVIGGGETTLLDMTSAYSVFANYGIRNPYQGILSVTDGTGAVLEQYTPKPYQVLDSNVTRELADVLSDNVARTPTFGANSALVVPGHDVAVKTGTTNNNKDAWTIGYTPSIAVGVWVGNNENTPMKKGGAALAGPIWNDVMTAALKNLPVEYFDKPDPVDTSIPPILRGFWQNGDTTSTEPVFTGQADPSGANIHTILYWINKNNPTGGRPSNPESDSQYTNWEYGVQKWWNLNRYKYNVSSASVEPTYQPTTVNTTGTSTLKPILSIGGLYGGTYKNNDTVSISLNPISQNPIKKIDVFVNNTYLVSLKSSPFIYSFQPSDVSNISSSNTIRAIVYDTLGNSGETTATFQVEN
jgi:penicillin-binding protein 1C